MKTQRDTDAPADEEKAKEQAAALHEAAEAGGEEAEKKFFETLMASSFAQCELISTIYEDTYDASLRRTIDKTFISIKSNNLPHVPITTSTEAPRSNSSICSPLVPFPPTKPRQWTCSFLCTRSLVVHTSTTCMANSRVGTHTIARGAAALPSPPL